MFFGHWGVKGMWRTFCNMHSQYTSQSIPTRITLMTYMPCVCLSSLRALIFCPVCGPKWNHWTHSAPMMDGLIAPYRGRDCCSQLTWMLWLQRLSSKKFQSRLISATMALGKHGRGWIHLIIFTFQVWCISEASLTSTAKWCLKLWRSPCCRPERS